MVEKHCLKPHYHSNTTSFELKTGHVSPDNMIQKNNKHKGRKVYFANLQVFLFWIDYKWRNTFVPHPLSNFS